MINFYRRLWPVLSSGTRWRLIVASALMVVIAGFEGLGLFLLLPLIQLLTSPHFSASSTAIRLSGDIFGAAGSDLALRLAIATLGAYVIRSVGAICVVRWNASFAMREEALLVRRLLRAYLGAPLPVHFAANTAQFQRTVNQSLRAMFAQAFVGVFSAAGDLLSLLIVAVVLVISDPLMAATGFVYFGIVVFLYQHLVQRSLKRAADEVHKEQAAAFQLVQQSLASVKEVKAAAVEEHFVDQVYASRRDMLDAFRVIALTAVQPRYVLELAMVGGTALASVLAFSTRPVPAATAGIAVFMAGGFRMLAPITKVFNGISQARIAQPAAEQVVHDLSTLGPLAADELRESPVAVELRPFVRTRDLSFSYDGKHLVLDGVDLDINPGEQIALVGESGAGKSTMVDLLLGLLEPTMGTLEIDGHPIAEVRRNWQRMVGYVPQAISLLDDSVQTNIVFGNDEIDTERLWAVLETAQLADVVRRLPDGLDTHIGERGVRLSGGQRQRLGIARALYPGPVMLVLDEATSALDGETELRVTEVLETLRGTITTLMVAHRLSTVRNADRTYFFSQGRILDSGTFEELQERVPGFSRLVDLASLPGMS